jgi:catechol 2,3-dioxygenase
MNVSRHDIFGAASGATAAGAGGFGMPPSGFRLPASTHIGGVVLQVSDLAHSRAFYESVLGLAPLESAEGRVTLGAADGGQALIELRENAAGRALPPKKSLGLFHVAILLPSRGDLARFVLHLQQLNARAGASDHLVSEAFYLQDPDDLGIEVYADKPRDRWRQEQGQLLMATDPINMRDLLLSAGEGEWRGMPQGTTIGHVHLHVGNLAEASRFYSDGVGLDRTVWSYPSALFMAAGGYHHHLGTNTWAGASATAPASDAPQLLEWTLVLDTAATVQAAASSLRDGGYTVDDVGNAVRVRDPWGTPLRLRAK